MQEWLTHLPFQLGNGHAAVVLGQPVAVPPFSISELRRTDDYFGQGESRCSVQVLDMDVNASIKSED